MTMHAARHRADRYGSIGPVLFGLALVAVLFVAGIAIGATIWESVPQWVSAIIARCVTFFDRATAAIALHHLLAIGVALVVGYRFVASLVHQRHATRAFLRSITRGLSGTISHEVRQLLPSLGLRERDIVLVDAPIPSCFSAGFLRPRIYCSRLALAALEREHLRAVLAHERAHLLRLDPLRAALLEALRRALFFVPIMGAWARRDTVARELRADAYAMRGHPDGNLHLAHALYVLSAPVRWAVAPPASAVPFAAPRLLAIRTAAIAGRPYVNPPFPRWSIVGSVAGCIVAAALFLAPPHVGAMPPPVCTPTALVSGSVQQSASLLERGAMTPSTTFASYAFTQAPAWRR